MDVLLAVIDDLWQFAYGSLFGTVAVTKEHKEREVQSVLPLTPKLNDSHQTKLFPSVELVNDSDQELRVGEQYFVGEMDTYLYSDPVIAFDTAMEKLLYAQPVFLKKIGGRWAEVLTDGHTGWILKDVLALRKEDVHPEFTEGVMYDAHHVETIKLRACINDQFCGARADLPLLSTEYATYQLQLFKRHIAWHKDSPRVPGSWQHLLKGLAGIHMSVLPKAQSVMEYIIDDVGHLAFVEAVFPDNSIKIKEVGYPEDGFYREIIMVQEEYRELRPIFIEVN